MKYQTKGTCSTSIDVEVENGKVKFVEFFGGCNGNLKGIASNRHVCGRSHHETKRNSMRFQDYFMS